MGTPRVSELKRKKGGERRARGLGRIAGPERGEKKRGGKGELGRGKGLGPGGWLGFLFLFYFIFQSISTSEFESNTSKPKSQKHRIKYAPA